MSVLTDLRNRGVKDVFFLVCDGLKGLPEAINTVWEFTTVQACIIHLIRNTFRYGSRKYWDQIAHDLRPVYTAATEAEARARFEEFAEKWGKSYPAISGCGRTPGRSSCRSWTTTWRSARSSAPRTPSGCCACRAGWGFASLTRAGSGQP
jgi:transposase-like protein